MKHLEGQRFGKLVAISASKRKVVGTCKTPLRYWLCQCDCGNQIEITTGNLTRGRSTSCGCAFIKKRHGHTWRADSGATPEYRAWDGMKSRCYRSKGHKKHYADRGITVCERWLNSFPNFLADMGMRPGPAYSLDRIDNDKGYEPDNCRWATISQQNQNKRYGPQPSWRKKLCGEDTAIDIESKTGVPASTVRKRYREGLRGEELYKPINPRFQGNKTKRRSKTSEKASSPPNET